MTAEAIERLAPLRAAFAALTAAELYRDGAVSVRDALPLSGGLKKTTLYDLMNAGVLPYSEVGRRRVLPRRAVAMLLEMTLVRPPAPATA